MKKTLFKGSGTAIATPFNNNGVNEKAFRKLLQYQLDNKTDAIIVCGTTGEASTMTQEEKKIAIECAVHTIDGKIPVIAGVGCNNFKKLVKLDIYFTSFYPFALSNPIASFICCI